MQISRAWSMPHHMTFKIPPIAEFLKRHIEPMCIDPFAGFSRFADITNDLNPDCKCDYNLPATHFLEKVINTEGHCRTVIFDPPYSMRQAKECYESVGIEFLKPQATNAVRWSNEKNLVAELKPHKVLTFGWNSNGMGKSRGYQIDEILLVAHGSGHNDTICVAESANDQAKKES